MSLNTAASILVLQTLIPYLKDDTSVFDRELSENLDYMTKSLKNDLNGSRKGLKREANALKISIEAAVESRKEKEEDMVGLMKDALEKKREAEDLKEKLLPQLEKMRELEQKYDEAKAFVEHTHFAMNDDDEWITDRANKLEAIIEKSSKMNFWGGGIDDVEKPFLREMPMKKIVEHLLVGARDVGFDVSNVHDLIMKLGREDRENFRRFLLNGGLEKNFQFEDKGIIVSRIRVDGNMKESASMEVTRTANYLRPKADLVATHNSPTFKEKRKFNFDDIIASPQYKKFCSKTISNKE